MTDGVLIAIIMASSAILVSTISGGVALVIASNARKDASLGLVKIGEVEDGIKKALQEKAARIGQLEGHAAGMQDGRDQLKADQKEVSSTPIA